MLREEIARHGADTLPAAGTLSEWPVAEVRPPLTISMRLVLRAACCVLCHVRRVCLTA